MFDKTMRLCDAVGLRLTPSLLRRFDRWLLVRAPLVWRTRLHWISWWALLLTFAAVGFGLIWPQSAGTAWSTAQVANLFRLVQLATWGFAIAWAVRQLQLF